MTKTERNKKVGTFAKAILVDLNFIQVIALDPHLYRESFTLIKFFWKKIWTTCEWKVLQVRLMHGQVFEVPLCNFWFLLRIKLFFSSRETWEGGFEVADPLLLLPSIFWRFHLENGRFLSFSSSFSSFNLTSSSSFFFFIFSLLQPTRNCERVDQWIIWGTRFFATYFQIQIFPIYYRRQIIF